MIRHPRYYCHVGCLLSITPTLNGIVQAQYVNRVAQKVTLLTSDEIFSNNFVAKLQIVHRVCQSKNFENQLIFREDNYGQ